MLLTKDQILNANDLAVETVEVPEWGGSVMIRTLSRCERDAFEDSLSKRKGKKVEVNMKNFTARLMALVMIDGSGQRLFTDDDTASIDKLGTKSSAAMQRCYEVATRLSGWTDKDVEDLTKNS